jgi:hypothetical protein
MVSCWSRIVVAVLACATSLIGDRGLVAAVPPDDAGGDPVASSATNVKSWSLYHAWETQQEEGVNYLAPQFHRRGTLRLMLDPANTENQVQWIVENEAVLSAGDVDTLIDNGWYYVQAVPNEGTKDSVVTSVPACQVRRSNFR